ALESTIGFWAAVCATIVSGLFLASLVLTFVVFPLDFTWPGIAAYASTFSQHFWQVLIFTIPCFLIAPSYLVMAVCIHRFVPENRKIWGWLGIAFAIPYLAQITQNYYLQMSAIPQNIQAGLLDGVALYAFGNFNSIFWSMEVLGYTWLSASMIFIGLLFRGGKMEAAIMWIFIVNGVLGVIAPVQAVFHLDFGGPWALLLFALTFPVSTAMIARLFHKAKNTGSMPF
ncbi:MAG TPA: hypothetical protein VMC61_01460, partial [Methanocella sp.]|nr:hypothetical protein [Methanocella sp.]